MTSGKPTSRRQRPIGELMTPAPHVVSSGQTVANALARMRALGIRHLPVVDEDRVVGVVTEREARLMYDIPQCDPLAMPVGDLVSSDPCVVGSDLGLDMAIERMAVDKVDCCVVLDRGRMVGIMTSSDIMHLLSAMLCAGSEPHDQALRPSEVRTRILGEHRVIRSLTASIKELAGQVLDDDPEADGPLRERCRELYQTLLRHIELENTILAPILVETDGFGPVRAEQMFTEHERQRLALHSALAALDDSAAKPLARDAGALVDSLLIDMTHEERALLDEELLRDDLGTVDVSTG